MPRKAAEAAAATKKPAVKKTTRRTTKTKTAAPSWDHIAERAYFIHLAEGGEPLANWLRAERELIAA
ncbi:MAG TPA: DUF2934 domain-containing protein [Gaiellaceae bacterium]|nr:DUF2934 domain-containing protein [Gaiellaceae bacterium]